MEILMGVAILYMVVRVCLSKQVTFKQRLEGS